MRNYISRTVPKTSLLHKVVEVSILWKATVLRTGKVLRDEGHELTVKRRYAFNCAGCELLASKKKSVYKNSGHITAHITRKLSGDIESNPGPYVIDPSRTICAPYSQGQFLVFGPNAGSQCVVMSLTAILYNSVHTIRSSADLVQIMNIGNELYKHLSFSARQEYLLLTEIPDVLSLGEATYNLICSESYFGNIFHPTDLVIEEANCVPLEQAFRSLLGENYRSFILTITILTVGIFQTTDGVFKVFDSHSRNCEGMNDPSGTCVLIELASLDHLLEYFQTMYFGRNDATYELKGVQVSTNDITTNVNRGTADVSSEFNTDILKEIRLPEADPPCSCQNCCVVGYYAICFSVLKRTCKWDDNRLEAVIENGNLQYQKLALKRHSVASDLPSPLKIHGAIVNVDFSTVYKGMIREETLLMFEEITPVVEENQKNNTGFLITISKCYNVACIFRRESKGKTCYVTFGLDETKEKGYFYETFQDTTKAIHGLCRIMTDKKRLPGAYQIQFMECTCELSQKERQLVIRRHKSVKQKAKRATQTRERYASTEPAKKRARLDNLAKQYTNMAVSDKTELRLRNSENYKRMKAENREQYNLMRQKNSEKYKRIKEENPEQYNAMRQKNSEKYKRVKEENPEQYNAMREKNSEKYKRVKEENPEQYNAMREKNSEKYKRVKEENPEQYSAMRQKNSDKYKRIKEENPQQYNLMRDKNSEKYKNMKEQNREQYNLMREKSALKYESMHPDTEEKYVSKQRRLYEERSSTSHSLDYYIEQFNLSIRDGPYYICVVCNRLLYRKSVIELKTEKYSSNFLCLFTSVASFNGNVYICYTCHQNIKKKKVPCQAVHNDLAVDDLPSELAGLEKLEQILISQRIVFEKIVVMPKGQQRKIKGAICTVPVNCQETCKVLPRAPESSGIILLKLKRKLQFKGHVYFQAVRSNLILNALHWLQANNPLYENTVIDLNNIDHRLKSIGDHENENESDETHLSCSDRVETGKNNSYDEETDDSEKEDPLNEYRAATCETCLQSIIPDYPLISDGQQNSKSFGNEIYDIAPGEGRHPVCIMTDKYCEELAFPVLFPKGRFGYKTERKNKLTPVKYFNARLLHYSGRFAMNPEYLFFAQFIIEQKKVSDSITIALKKLHGRPITASEFRSNEQCVKNLMFKDQAYLFLRNIPGSPPYWQKFMFEAIAMVQQLGIPTWFMTLSCADLRWTELFEILLRVNRQEMADKEIENLSYNEKCSLLNLNPVIVAKHFQYRVESFFKEVLLSNANPIGKIIYYALRIEFQMRGSLHLHSLIWTSDCPELTPGNEETYVRYIDKHVQAHLPERENEPEFHELVSIYQKHHHSRSCKKYKNIPCRFNFGQFFTDETVVSKPLSDDVSEEEKSVILNRRSEILSTLKQIINEKLDPGKANYDLNLTAEQLLASCKVSMQDYKWALSISADDEFELHLKRPGDSCFINNYFEAGIKGFRANVDLQPVFNHYKCITYVCSYFSKDETECSQAIKNATKEAKANNLNVKEGLKKVGAAFLSCREVSAQECVYRCMPELWLRKTFPGIVFVNTGLPQERLRVAKCQEELETLDEDSTDIFKSNIIERYSDRPTALRQLCLAEFAAYYYKDYKAYPDDDNDVQPVVLSDELVESHHIENSDLILPQKLSLLIGMRL